jgi:hypothetical protein
MRQAATVPVAVLVSLSLSLALASAAEVTATEWSVKPREMPGGGCVLESTPQSMSDGYQQTTVYFSVTPRSVALVSAAPLDGSGSDIGLAVDGEPFVRMDRLEGAKTALFDSKYDGVVAQFKAGTQVRVQLRFWPTWPATGAHSATLGLIGFTRAYGQLAGCR